MLFETEVDAGINVFGAEVRGSKKVPSEYYPAGVFYEEAIGSYSYFKNQLNLDEEAYRSILWEAFGVGSSKDLSPAQASDFIDWLKRQLLA